MIDQSYLDKMASEISAIETQLSDPATSANQSKMRSLLTEHARIKKLHTLGSAFLRMKDDLAESEALMEDASTDSDLREMAQGEIDELREKLPKKERELQIALLPADPDEGKNVIMEIRAGTGGDEAALFAGDLYRMYGRYAEDKGWKVTVIDASGANVGGFKEVTFSIEGQDVYKTLKYESGAHRVQRIPATEASGRIHTSAATVAVLPEAEEVDEIKIKPDEIRVDIFRSSGPGGQSVNTTDSAVRLTHLETGIIVQCQDEKSQHRNKEKAMRVLMARLLERKRQEEDAKLASERRSQIGSGDRSEKIRTYNYPQNRVTDHRIGLTLHALDRIMEGDLDEMVNALYDHDLDLKLQKATA